MKVIFEHTEQKTLDSIYQGFILNLGYDIIIHFIIDNKLKIFD